MKTIEYQTGHELLKAQRLSKGLTLKDVERMTGISFSYIRQLEAGIKQPTASKLLKLLFALGIQSKDYLKVIGYEEPKKSKMVAVQGIEPRTLRI